MMVRSHISITLLIIAALPAFAGIARGTPGDLNCSGDFDVGDVGPFVLALVDPAGHAAAYPGCDITQADMNLDGLQDGADIGPFVNALLSPPAEPTATELAGNSMSGYPYFQYVRAFHEGGTVKLAIDPFRFPNLTGACDIYVVENKSAGQWVTDPSLEDVRPGGPQTETFGGATIQDNTFSITGAAGLSGDAGTGLGVGYDLVVDRNRNGLLDAGDVIDGLSNEAGFDIVRDTTVAGPLAVTEVLYSGGSWLGQDTYYPTNIASMGELPLVVVSHGNGHDYTWYDHIGYHLASYGYIVMSHENNTGPGVETASTTTLTNTDYILGNQATIAGGVLNGHIDSHRITWIGHSRGAEGVVRAHTRVRTGEYTPLHFSIGDIVLVSSMCPVTHISPAAASTPYDANFHLFIAGADADVTGSPSAGSSKPLAFYERAFGNKQVVYVHGAGHGDFHDGGGSSVAEGPDLIGRAATHQVVRGYYLPLVKLYVENNLVAKDFLARMYETFHPAGIAGNVIIANYYRDAEAIGNFVVDDYQTETSTATSSSGGSVSFNVANLNEILMEEMDESFEWTGSQPSNGMTMWRYSDDNGHCVVFDWSTGSSPAYELEVIPGEQDFTRYTFLSFRACQGTRHPRTDALNSPLSFTATLRDGNGVSSSIDFAGYGRITRTYLRTGYGAGAGWANEFNTVRIRLTDFETDGSGLDLTNIEAIRFNFGSTYGSSQGRIGLDDIELTNDYPPYFVPLTISMVGQPPEFIPPEAATTIDVEILEGSDTLLPGSALLHYRYDGGAFQTAELVRVAGSLYRATLPPPACGDTPEFYFSAAGGITGVVYDPPSGASAPYAAFVGNFISIMNDNFEMDQGWTVENFSLLDGAWQRGIPAGDGTRGDPLADFDGSGRCYLTANRAGNSDVDGGPTRLISPTLDLSGTTDPVLRYARWWSNDDQDSDPFDVEVSNDDGGSWVLIERAVNLPAGWVERSVNLNGYITLTAQMKIRFSAMDNPNNSVDEGGVDAFEVFDVECGG
jgi:hypothetical protein